MEKTATSSNCISNHFSDTTLLCSRIVHKQESREMPQRNLTSWNANNLRDGTLSDFFLGKNNACQTAVNREHKVLK